MNGLLASRVYEHVQCLYFVLLFFLLDDIVGILREKCDSEVLID